MNQQDRAYFIKEASAIEENARYIREFFAGQREGTLEDLQGWIAYIIGTAEDLQTSAGEPPEVFFHLMPDDPGTLQ